MSAPTITRVTLLLSGGGTTFAAIQAFSLQSQSRFRITTVVSDNENAYGLTLAAAAGIDTHVIDYSEFGHRQTFDRALQQCVENSAADLVVLAGFMRIVSEEFVSGFRGRMLNIHPSLLPKYPGLNTYERALQAGETAHGSTVHFVSEVLDGGPLIAQAIVPIDNNDNTTTLSAKVQEAERKLYPIVINWFAQGRLKQVDQLACLDGNLLRSPRQYQGGALVGDEHVDIEQH